MISDFSNDWEITPRPLLPPRSRLYGLAPVGLGTGMVESLTSYICRLAEAHSLFPWILVTREISPLASVATLKTTTQQGRRNASCYLFGKVGNTSVISNGQVAEDAVRVLGQLTGRSDLSKLTAIFTEGILSSKGMLAKHQRWCPQCLESWKFAGAPIYFPMLWQFQQTAVCTKHYCQLEAKCPHCGNELHPISRKLQPGFCPNCAGWLGAAAPVELTYSPDSVDLFAVDQLQQILANGALIEAAGKGGWARSMTWIIENWFEHAEGFARDVGVHPRSLRNWLPGLALPSMTSVISLSYQLNLQATDLLLGRVDRFASVKRGGILRPIKPLKRKNQKHDLNQLRQAMEEAAESKAIPPESLVSVSKRTNVHLSFLGRKFPELAARIKERHSVFQQKKAQERVAHVEEVVRAAVATIVAAGYYPGASRMRKTLPSDVKIIEPAAKRVWLEEIAALKLEKAG